LCGIATQEPHKLSSEPGADLVELYVGFAWHLGFPAACNAHGGPGHNPLSSKWHLAGMFITCPMAFLCFVVSATVIFIPLYLRNIIDAPLDRYLTLQEEIDVSSLQQDQAYCSYLSIYFIMLLRVITPLLVRALLGMQASHPRQNSG
jgi:hypothetical protein